ncbi:MAG: carbon-nitrogen hydrolase family protein [Candidatus Dormibacteraceae bacterium]
MATVRIALGQFTGGEDKRRNLERMLAQTEEAAGAGARLVCFPEVAMALLEDPKADRWAVAETLDGPFVAALREGARRNRIAIVAGIMERSEQPGKVYNSALALGPDGGDLGVYRKVHLFDAFGERESDHHQPGAGDLLLFDLDGARFGVTICYDLRFPELFRALAERGADAILLPTAWMHGRLKELHLSTLSRARAIENTVYFAAADLTNGVTSGNSELIDPMGVTVAAIGEEEGLVVGTVDTERVARVRAKVPTLTHVRPDLYAQWLRVPEAVR